jgi:hypothetical protein
MLIYQIFKELEDGTPDYLCGGTTKWKAEVILRESYPQEKGRVVWLDVIRKEGKLKIVDGKLIP